MAEGVTSTNQDFNGPSSSNGEGSRLESSKQMASFCDEVTDPSVQLPEVLHVLYSNAKVQDKYDALTVVLHVLMLEAGFFPKNVEKGLCYKLMPTDWKGQGVYRIVYSHPTCPDICCRMTSFPMDSLFMVYGTIDGNDADSTSQLQLQLSTYVNSQKDFSCPLKVFCQLRKLSQTVKDNIAHRLLASAQSASGIPPTFGLSTLIPEIKLQILSYLTVKQLTTISAVNKDLHELSNLPFLWKRLFLHDFSEVTVEDANTTEWKELYKNEFLNRQRRQRMFRHSPGYIIPAFHSFPPPPHPGILGGDVDRDFDLRFGISSEIDEAFPNLSRRLQEPALPLPSIHPPNLPRMFLPRFF